MLLDSYRKQLDFRFPSMTLALEWFDQHNGSVIVETGCQRLEDDWGGGCSTKLFGEYASTHPDVAFYSVDISEDSLAVARKVTEGLPVNFVKSDSVEFLKGFQMQVDFLYLDSFDCDPRPEAENRDAQNHQLNEFKAIEPMLNSDTVVLLDDCGYGNGGKGRLTRLYLKEKGWKELWNDYQSLWVR